MESPSPTPETRLQTLLRRSLTVDDSTEAATSHPTFAPGPRRGGETAEAVTEVLPPLPVDTRTRRLTRPRGPSVPERTSVNPLRSSRRTKILGAVVLCGCAVVLGTRAVQAQPEVSKPTPSTSQFAPSRSPGPAGAAWAGTSATTAPPARVTVHVVGAVRRPSVVSVATGARVHDAVTAAGGFTAEADRNSVNLARVVNDGERITIPKQGDTPPSSEAGTPSGDTAKVHLNTATAQQLEALPGIGAVMAQRIVTWRQQHGPFTSINQLTEVQGVGSKLLKKLEGYLDL